MRGLVIAQRLVDQLAQLLRYFVADQTESRHRRFVVRNDRVLLELATGERVEILARIHRLVDFLQQLGG